MAFIAKTDWKQSDLVETTEFNRINKGVVDNKTTLTNHIADKNNPHNVTKEQVGLSDVDNTSLANKPTSKIFQKMLDNKADKDLSNVTAKDFKNKAIIAGVGGDIIPDNKVRFNIQLTSEDGGGIANAFVYAIINNITIADALTSDTGQTLIEIEPGNNTSVTIKVTPSNNRYDEAVITYDNINTYLGTSQNITINLEKRPIITYGFTIDATNSNPDTAIVYTDDCAGWTPIRGDANGNIDMGSWANKWPLTAIRPCLYKDGEVVAYLNPNDYTKTVDGTDADITSGAAGDVMIEIPTIYYKVEPVKDASGVTTSSKITISDTEQEGFDCYAHYRINSADIDTYPSPTIKLDYIYIGAYTGSTLGSVKTIRSLSEAGTEGTLTYSTYYTGYTNDTTINSYGSPANLSFLRNSDWTLIKLLFVLLVKSINSDHFYKITYKGESGGGFPFPWNPEYKYVPSGWGDKLGMFASHPDGKSVKFLGIENLWTKSRYTRIMDLNQSEIYGANPNERHQTGKYTYYMYSKNGRYFSDATGTSYPEYTFNGPFVNIVSNKAEGFAARYYKPIIDDPYVLFLPTITVGTATSTTYTCDALNCTNGYGDISSGSNSAVGFGGVRVNQISSTSGIDGLFCTYAIGNSLELNNDDYYRSSDAAPEYLYFRLSTKY